VTSSIPAPEAPAQALLRLAKVTRSYGPLVAVHGLDLEVHRGETFGLLGPNGAGKSTLMRMIVGAQQPDDGTIRMAGLSLALATARARVGIAPQDIALYGNLSAEENLAFFARLYGLSGARLVERVQYGLEIAGLTARRGDRVKTFSGGMQRRLNLACAVVHEPELVLLDEPTAGVDPQSRNHIFESLEKLKAEGLTVIYSTHYMEEAERLCDRVGIIDHGQLLALGSVKALIDRYGGKFEVTVKLEGSLPPQVAEDARFDGDMVRFATDDPWRVLESMSHSGARLSALHIDRPNLESVFLSLTGRNLRD
jgi:ABC-2 type transport system ATP-binding protein